MTLMKQIFADKFEIGYSIYVDHYFPCDLCSMF